MRQEIPNSVEIRFARPKDLRWCVQRDKYASEKTIRKKIRDEEILIAETNGERIGFLRFEYMWSRIPFIAFVLVDEKHRGCGVGRRLLSAFMEAVRGCGRPFVLSSSMANEPRAQQWHRKMGFEECGFLAGINKDGIGEVFFIKWFDEGSRAAFTEGGGEQ